MNNHKKILSINAILSITLFLSLSSSPAANADELYYSPDSTPFNIQFKEWSAQWWQFVSSIPNNENPLTDSTGARCLTGQRGPVWFLVGTSDNPSSPVNRVCTIPAGKALFFPVLNTIFGDSIADHNSIDFLRDGAAALMDEATTLSVTVDGQAIQHIKNKFRVRSNVFSVTFPDDSIFGVGTDVCPPSGTCSPAIDDGYYVMLKPLKVGKHTIHIIGARPTFNVDTTYTLTVVPVDLKGI